MWAIYTQFSITFSYIAWTGDFELAGEGEKETLEQKYQRLNCDVRQLMDELENLKESGAEKVGNQSLIGLAKQTALLQDQLAGMKLEEYLGSAPVKGLIFWDQWLFSSGCLKNVENMYDTSVIKK